MCDWLTNCIKNRLISVGKIFSAREVRRQTNDFSLYQGEAKSRMGFSSQTGRDETFDSRLPLWVSLIGYRHRRKFVLYV